MHGESGEPWASLGRSIAVPPPGLYSMGAVPILAFLNLDLLYLQSIPKLTWSSFFLFFFKVFFFLCSINHTVFFQMTKCTLIVCKLDFQLFISNS